ncbi:MFS transporter [Aliidongia dinghuensis]|uniref:MFS transporter n=1 Tax=Aliidongia dinghuensis TaxID=1867774 RepID=A0A8J2YQH6_9PROT|nr:MFS transporter [Aliidongia dinghuensis]GGF05632.1 MFS transporter [Aliidongia dinghuensis]
MRARLGALGLGASGRVLFVLCLLYMILYIDRVNISTSAPLIRSELKLSNAELGLAFSAFAYPYALFQLVGGWLGDRFGPRRVLGLCGIVVILSTLATGLVGGLASLIAARFALGLGEGATFPTATRAMAGWVPEARWGFAQGITHSAARIGNAVTPPLVALLVAYLSWRGSFVVFALLNLLWLVPWVWVSAKDGRRTALPAARVGGTAQRSATSWWALARRMLPVTCVDFCYGWTLWLFLSWIPSFFYDSFKLDLKGSALFSTGVFAAGVVGDLLGGMVSDRILKRTGRLAAARRNVIIVGFLGAFLCLIPVVAIHDLTIDALFLSLAFFSAELIVGPIWSVPMDIAPRHAGSASGLMNLGFGVAGIISPSCFGYLIDLTGTWTVPFAVSMGLLLAGAGLAYRMRPDEPFIDPAEPAPPDGELPAGASGDLA